MVICHFPLQTPRGGGGGADRQGAGSRDKKGVNPSADRDSKELEKLEPSEKGSGGVKEGVRPSGLDFLDSGNAAVPAATCNFVIGNCIVIVEI